MGADLSSDVVTLVFLVATIVLASTSLIGLALARRGRQGTRALAEAVAHWTSQDLSYRVGASGHKETDELLGALQHVVDEARYNSELAREMEQRTQELHEQVSALQFMESVTIAANVSTTGTQAVQKILALVCDQMAWPIGHAYSVEGDMEASGTVLVPSKIWHFRDPAKLGPVRAALEKVPFNKEEGLPNRVLTFRKPVWVEDIAEKASFPESKIFTGVGIRSAMAFPVFADKELVTVLEFFDLEPLKPDVHTMELMALVGNQLGRAIERVRFQRQLKSAREAAESANRAKSSFLATMSHEIRTPMNAVLGMTELLMDTDMTDKQSSFTNVINQSGQNLMTIINDILDFSKVEAGKLELEQQPFTLLEALDSALDIVALGAKEKDIEIGYLVDPRTPATVIGDVVRFRQILMNLLNNAMKFTTRGGVIVSVTPELVYTPTGQPQQQSGNLGCNSEKLNQLYFTIRDTGIGIPSDRINKIFQPFSQVDESTARRFGGTGLGLAITTQLVKLMGGRIWVESQVGQGSTFHFTLTLPWEPTLAIPALPLAHLSNKKLLIVDDNMVGLRVVAQQCETWGLTVRATTTPQEALAWVTAGEAFDLALIDLVMPDMDGLELGSKIRQYRNPTSLPMLLLAPLGSVPTPDRMEHFEDCLTKPLRVSQFHGSIMNILHTGNHKDAASPSSRVPSLSTTADRPSQEFRILLAEDNAFNRQLALGMLATLGHTADVAVNGLEVLAALHEKVYDIIFMDVQMPEMDGLETSRVINEEHPQQSRPYIIAMTANAMQGDREMCLAAGMDDYITKPFTRATLAKSLNRAGFAMFRK